MPIELTAALVGLGSTLFGVLLSSVLRVGRGERYYPARLRELLMIRDAGLPLDAEQKCVLEFEIAWATSQTLGSPSAFRAAALTRPYMLRTFGFAAATLVVSVLWVVATVAFTQQILTSRLADGILLACVVLYAVLFGLTKNWLWRRWFRRWLEGRTA